MRLGPQARHVLAHPGPFVLHTLKAFRANQGLLLAGAVAYYALLSIVPLLILIVIALSHVIDQAELLATLGRYLEVAAAGPVEGDRQRAVRTSSTHRDVIGLGAAARRCCSSARCAFTVLENAMSVIFLHRVAIRRRHFLVSALLPYCYILYARRRPAAGDAGRRQPAGDGPRRPIELLGRAVVAARRLGRCCCTCSASSARCSC